MKPPLSLLLLTFAAAAIALAENNQPPKKLPTAVVDGQKGIVTRDGKITVGQPPEKTDKPGEPPEPPEKKIASGDLSGKQQDPEGCGALAVGIDPDMAASERPGDVPVKAGFKVKFQEEISDYSLISTTIMPGKTMTVEAVSENENAEFSGSAEGGKLEKLGPAKWKWTAPEKKGYYCVKIQEETSGDITCINTFVLVPYNGEETLNGYRIGHYPREPLHGDPAYDMPEGFIEVTEENRDTWLSPHLQLRQFLCKQESSGKEYVLVRPRLLLKLEALLEEVNAEGIPASSFYLVSAYRTPYYNKSIGNDTRYSRHAYGDAADIMIDMDADGTIDDVNDDGKINDFDPQHLYNLVDDLSGTKRFKRFAGGLGFYRMKPWRSGFIHVDTRGQRVRW